MDKRALISNAVTAFAAQGIGLLVAAIQSVLVPKVLGVEAYGYWQLFVFYISYVGFFHLGLNDGVYLIKGGESREEISKPSVNSQFLFSVGYQLVFAAVIVCLALAGLLGPDRSFIIACTGGYLVLHNAAAYLMFVLQAMNETKKSSYATVVERLAYCLPLFALLGTGVLDFRPYVAAQLAAAAIQLLYCLYQMRDFPHAGLLTTSETLAEAAESIRVGLQLMLAGIASQLILGIARFAIDWGWGVEVFGKLSLSITLANFFMVFVSQASMVLFPAMRQSEAGTMRRFVETAEALTSLAFPILYVSYFPLVLILGTWLPAYAESLTFLAALLPVCLFDCKTNLIYYTFYKVERRERTMLLVNLVVAGSAALATWGATVLAHSYNIVILIAAIAIVSRSRYCSQTIARELDITLGTLPYAEIVVAVAFTACCSALPLLPAFGLYLLVLGTYLVAYRKKARLAFRAIGRS